jgi:catechol 2,3-dioxygenase-like lactoylglutathione lyase family enzyme
MICHLHHTHLFASDINKSIQFYTEFFGGRVVMDLEMAGSRNIFLSIGRGRLHFYDQAPKNPVRGNIHHLGLQTDNLEEMVKKFTAGGVPLKKGITDFGFWKYITVLAPDDVLIELFQVDQTQLNKDLSAYFDLDNP